MSVACEFARVSLNIHHINFKILDLMRAGCQRDTVQALIDIAKEIEADDPVDKKSIKSDKIQRYGDLQLLTVFEILNNWTIDNPLSIDEYSSIHLYFPRYMQQYVAYFITSSARYSNLTINADSDFLVKHIAFDYAYEIAQDRARDRIANVDRSEYCLPRMTEQERNTPLPIKDELIEMFEHYKDERSNGEESMELDSDLDDSQVSQETDNLKG